MIMRIAITAAFFAIPAGVAAAFWTGNPWWLLTLFILCGFL
jgi:1,4-dihydroxy-2-naphthoate octaprenyltransferase